MKKENFIIPSLTITHLICFILLLFFVVQIVITISVKSATSDEPVYLKTGKYITSQFQWDTKDSIAHPPLSYYTHGLFTKPFTFKDQDKELFWARMTMIPYAIILGLYVFLWTRELYGRKAALIALFLYSFSPNIIAHASLITTDVILTCFFIATLYHFWRYTITYRKRDIFFSGITFGFALLSKYSAVILVPILFILTLILSKDRKVIGRYFRSLIIVTIIGILVLNIGYGFEETPLFVGSHRFSSSLFNVIFKIPFLRDIPFPMPKPFVYGVDFQKQIFEAGYPNFLMGIKSTNGWWYYFIIAFLIKTPITLLIMIFFVIIFAGRQSKEICNELFLIIPFIFLFIYVGFNEINGVLRYILPIYPLSYIFVGRWVYIVFKKKWINPLILSLLLCWYIISNISTHPHYLAYFNELIGGPRNGYKYLGASDLDWKQDNKLLKKYIKKSKDMLENKGCYPTVGKIAIQTNYLQGVFYRDDCFNWLKNFEPVDYIGYSILVFDLTVEDFEKKVLESPQDTSAHAALGWIYYKIGNNSKAIEKLNQAIQKDHLSSQAITMKGIVFYNIGMYEQALRMFKKAIIIEPRESKPRYWLALTYSKMGFSDLAKSAYTKAVAIDVLSWYDKDIDFDLKNLLMKLKRDYNNPKLHNNLGFMFWLEGKPKLAVNELKKAYVLCNDCADIYANLSYIFFDMGEYKKAFNFLQLYRKIQRNISSHHASRVAFSNTVRRTTFMLDDWLVLPTLTNKLIILKAMEGSVNYYILAEEYLRANRPFAAMEALNHLDSYYTKFPAFQEAKWKIENW